MNNYELRFPLESFLFCHPRVILSGNHVFLSCSNASIGHPCSFYRGTITSSGFPLKACGNDSVVELSVLCILYSVFCLLSFSTWPLESSNPWTLSFLSSPSDSIGEPCFSVMLECLYRASMQFLSGNHVFLSCSNASIGHPCSFYLGTITSSGFPLKACGNDSVVELSVLCILYSVFCLLSSVF